jgi:hypothetical protein
MLRWIARCLLLHGVAPCELMGDTERSLHISLLFDLPWQADLAALATPTSPAVLSGGTSLGKWNLSFVLKGNKLAYSTPSWYVTFQRRLTPIVHDILFFPLIINVNT